ncbi:hypothetical protein BD310DRAFT_913210 [Dichomitus squalens]|uniref:Uncharacterized protein n=1 Tax=Dichomitus squalens TaxID=114155 RepID=A0A4Q9QAT6_9APHY|nr:hypothetical protein BD310DRAFT_913210 [Dichomitus squalens]
MPRDVAAAPRGVHSLVVALRSTLAVAARQSHWFGIWYRGYVQVVRTSPISPRAFGRGRWLVGDCSRAGRVEAVMYARLFVEVSGRPMSVGITEKRKARVHWVPALLYKQS